MNISGIEYWIKSGRITIIMLIIVSFWLPLSKNILPALLALTFLFFLLQRKRKLNFELIFREKQLILLILFYLLHAISLLYSADLNKGFFDLEVKLSILIFPVIFLFIKIKDLVNISNKVFHAFIVGNIIASVICIIFAFYNSINNGEGELLNISIWTNTRDWSTWKLLVSGYSYFNYTWFSYFHHPAYFGMYLVFAAYLAFYYLKNTYKKISDLRRAFYISSVLLFVVMILLLQSRAVILTAFVIIFFELGRTLIISKKYFIPKVSISIATIVLTLVFIFSNVRFKSFDSFLSNGSANELKATNIRLEIWEKSTEIIKENLFFGVGTGDVKNELKKKYNTESLAIAKEKGYNAHNQFFETFLGVGIPGIAVLLFILFTPFFRKINFYDFPIIIIFSLILSTGFVFESMFNTIAGVSFFGLFYSLLSRNELQAGKQS